MQAVLKSIPGFCIACHTRSTSPDLSSLQMEVPNGLNSPLERAEFFDATRQFDRALDEFEKILADTRLLRTIHLSGNEQRDMALRQPFE